MLAWLSTVWIDTGIYFDLNFASSEEDAQVVQDGWIASLQPTFPNVYTTGPMKCWVEADDKATFLGFVNGARSGYDFPQSGNIPAWLKVDKSPRATGENSKTEEKGAGGSDLSGAGTLINNFFALCDAIIAELKANKQLTKLFRDRQINLITQVENEVRDGILSITDALQQLIDDGILA